MQFVQLGNIQVLSIAKEKQLLCLSSGNIKTLFSQNEDVFWPTILNRYKRNLHIFINCYKFNNKVTKL